MKNRRLTLSFSMLLILALVLVAGLGWLNSQYIQSAPGRSAFTPCWAAARYFMTDAWSPYSAETLQKIQQEFYNRPARSTEDPGFYAYPFYTLLICFPFALTDNLALARTLWMVALELALLGLLAGGLSLSRWRPPAWLVGLLLIFTIFWLPGLRPLLSGNLSILSALLVVAALLVIRAGQDPLAGFLLVLAALRGEALILLLVFVLVWSASVQRWTLFWGIVGSFVLLTAAASLLLPDWTTQYVRRLVDLSALPLLVTPGRLVSYWLPGIGKQLGWLFTLLALGLLLFEWRAALGKDFRWFLWTAYLTLAATVLAGVPSSQENYILLLPAFLLILATWDQRWGRLGAGLIAFSLLALSFGLWGLALSGARRAIPPDLDPLLFFIPPLFILLCLYWVRWWAIRPPRLLVEELAQGLQG